MINKPYSYSHIFHEEENLSFRKQVFQRYAEKYNVRLYCLRPGFAFPELLFKEQYSDLDFIYADGIAVGDTIEEDKVSFPSVANPFEFYHLASTRSGRSSIYANAVY